MGHADKIHKEHHRLPQIRNDMLQIARYLETVQENEQTVEKEPESNSDYQKETS